MNTAILGASPDPVRALAKFRDKHQLTFPLLSDESHRVAEAYGVWKLKSTFGVQHWGVERTTFLIDPEGRVAHVFQKVNPVGHAAEVAAILESLPLGA